MYIFNHINPLLHNFIQKPCTSVDFDAEGKVIVVGTAAGRFIVLSALDGMHVFSMQAGAQQISVVNFSPGKNVVGRGYGGVVRALSCWSGII